MCREVSVPWSFLYVWMADMTDSMISGHQGVFLALSRDLIDQPDSSFFHRP